MRRVDKGVAVWGALGIVYVVWGSTYLAIRVVVETMPPMLASGVRFAVSGAIFWIGLRAIGGRERLRVGPRELAGALLIGSLLCMGGNGLVSVAETDVPSGLAALVLGSIPLWVVLMRTVSGDRVAPMTLAGVALGFVGLAVLVLPGDRPGDAPLWGLLVLVAAAFSWALGTFLTPRTTLPRDVLASTAWQLMLGGAASLVVGLAVGEGGDVHADRFSTDSLLALAYLIFVGSLIAYTAYTWLLRNAPVSKVATYAYVNPVIAIVLGSLILDEEVTPTMVIAATVIVASVAIVVRRESGERAPDRTPA